MTYFPFAVRIFGQKTQYNEIVRTSQDKIKEEINMTFYFVSLALGLCFIYSVRDMLLVLQNRREEKIARMQAKADSDSIIQQNQKYCNRFERAS